MNLKVQTQLLFQITTDSEFNVFALKIFQYQYTNNAIYQQFVNYHLSPSDIKNIDHYLQIPFIPIEFFKTHQLICEGKEPDQIFSSSGTTGDQTSKHYIADIQLYETSFKECFRKFFGKPEDYLILALLPSYLEREGSSLVYMAKKLIEQSKHKSSGFYLDHYQKLLKTIQACDNHKIILLGVTFGLLELAEKYEPDLSGVIVMETGGMKGRRKEIVREELHRILCSKFNVEKIYSEYGMTELLSQAYSMGEGIFNTPPWMKILIRDTNDPMTILTTPQTGGINIIDLANIYSCSFIATQDLGKLYSNGSFEVLGRFDASDIRGCNLLIN